MSFGGTSRALRPQVKVCGITNEEDARLSVSLGASMLGIIFAKSSPRYLCPSDAQKLVSQCPSSFCFVGVFVDADAERVREIASFVGLQKLQFQGSESPAYCHSFSLAVIKAFRVDKDFVLTARREAQDALKDALKASPQASPQDSLQGLPQWLPQHYERVSAHLFDSKSTRAHGGSGESFDWQLLNLLEETKNGENNSSENNSNHSNSLRIKPWILAGGINAENVERAIRIVRPDALDLSSALGRDDNPREKDERKMEQFFRAIDKTFDKTFDKFCKK